MKPRKTNSSFISEFGYVAVKESERKQFKFPNDCSGLAVFKIRDHWYVAPVAPHVAGLIESANATGHASVGRIYHRYVKPQGLTRIDDTTAAKLFEGA